MFLSPDSISDALWPGLVIGGLFCAVLPWLRRDHNPTRMVLIAVALALMANYMIWRFWATLPPVGLTLDFIAGVIFVTVEAAALLGAMVSLAAMSRTRERTSEVEAHLPALLARPKLPLVHVFICTYNEEQAILERTITGALNLDYPNFKVFILDDGRREWLRGLCDQLGCEYIARYTNVHAKAGNINHALKKVAQLPEPPEFISILDADFVPLPAFLKRAMALFHEGDVGVVQTPQHFVNSDPIQTNLSAASVWPDEQRFFFDVVMASKDAWGAAFCCGTSSVIRAEPLLAMGGFPTDSVTEDYLLTLRLKERGYRTVYLNEALSFGLAPEGLKEYITQRSRWCLGFMQICRGRSGPLSKKANIGLLDRVFLIETFLYWSAAHAFRLLGMIVPVAYLLFNVVAVNVHVTDFLAHYLPCFIGQAIVITWLTQGRVMPVMSDVVQLVAAPAIIRAVVSGLVKPQNQKFQVTAKGGERSRRFIEWTMLRTFATLLVLTLVGVVYCFLTGIGPEYPGASVLALFWSWFNIVILTIACYICIEQPRQRKAERFDTAEQAILITGATASTFAIADISGSGARFIGKAPGKRGETILVRLTSCTVKASIAREGADFFAVKFDDTLATRVLLVRHTYSGRYSRALGEIRWIKVLRAVSARVLG